MNSLDLDQLRHSWHTQSRAVDAQLQLDLDALRGQLAARTRRALDRHQRGLLLQLLAGAAGVVLALGFLLRHGGELASLLSALALLALLLAWAAVDLLQWRDLRRLDYAAPVLELRAGLDRILVRRLRLVRLIVYISPLLWWPLLLVVLKGLWRIDLMDYLHPSVLAVTAVAGVALIALLEIGAGQVVRRWPDSPALRRFQADLAGSSWRQASDALQGQEDLQRGVDAGAAAQLLRQGLQALPETDEAQRHRLARRTTTGLWLASLLILLSGGFNAAHGGQAGALLPGITLHLCGIAWLIAAIRHRAALARPQSGVAPWRACLADAARVRRRLLQGLVVAAPLLLGALVQVTGLALARVDIAQSLGALPSLLLGLAAAACSALLGRRWRSQREGFAASAVEALSLGTLHASRALAQPPPGDHAGGARAAA